MINLDDIVNDLTSESIHELKMCTTRTITYIIISFFTDTQYC